jgi:predicted phosphate transport protein (TIGR00153 family)
LGADLRDARFVKAGEGKFRSPCREEERMVFGRLMPKNENFFEMFDVHAGHIMKGANAFMAMIQNYAVPDLREKYAAEVDAAEHAADKVTAEVNRKLHRTFITPIDREQIHGLINAMDDILDLLQDTGEVMALYNVQHLPNDVERLGEISVRCCLRVQSVVSMLPNLSRADVAEAALKTCEEIDRLESDADRVMRGAMSKLFRDDVEVRELIKLKAIYEHLESISDRCEDVANLIEGVVLENS